MIKRIAIFVIAIAVLVAVILTVDFEALVGVFRGMSRRDLTLFLSLFVVSSIIKGFRWAFYLRSARLRIAWKDGVTSFLGAMSTSALPGGSWLAPRLAQEHGDIRMRQAAAALFISFVCDALAVSLVCAVAFFLTGQSGLGYLIPAMGTLFGIVLIIMGRSHVVWQTAAKLFERWPLTRRWLPKELEVQLRIRALMRADVIAGGVAFSALVTILSGASMFVIVNSITFRGITPIEGVLVSSTAEAATFAIPIPGGIGIKDTGTTGILTTLGIGVWRATFVAIILRSTDVIFKATFGTLTLLAFYRDFLFGGMKTNGRVRRWRERLSNVPGIRAFISPHAPARSERSQPRPPAEAPTVPTEHIEDPIHKRPI